MPMLTKNNIILDYFMHHKEEKYPLGNEDQDGKDNQRDLDSQKFRQ